MVVLRATGCGRVLGVALIVVGAVILLAYLNVIPHSVSRWWPSLIILLGLLMLLRHYMRLVRNRSNVAPQVIDQLELPVLPPQRRKLRPPAGPIIVIALGAYVLLSNLHAIKWGVILPGLLILIGLAVLVSTQNVWRRA